MKIQPEVYVFADRMLQQATEPGTLILHAGGIQHCAETVEELVIIEHDSMVRVGLDGVYIKTLFGEERIAEPKLHISDRLIGAGITDNWFMEGWTFGNGVTSSKTQAQFDVKRVDHRMGLTYDEIMAQQGYIDMSPHLLFDVHDRTEGWKVYENRWKSGYCPQCTHTLPLVWMVTKGELGGYGYKRLQDIIEEGAPLKHPEAYSQEPGKYFSTTRTYDTTKKCPSASILSELGVTKADLRKLGL